MTKAREKEELKRRLRQRIEELDQESASADAGPRQETAQMKMGGSQNKADDPQEKTEVSQKKTESGQDKAETSQKKTGAAEKKPEDLRKVIEEKRNPVELKKCGSRPDGLPFQKEKEETGVQFLTWSREEGGNHILKDAQGAELEWGKELAGYEIGDCVAVEMFGEKILSAASHEATEVLLALCAEEKTLSFWFDRVRKYTPRQLKRLLFGSKIHLYEKTGGEVCSMPQDYSLQYLLQKMCYPPQTQRSIEQLLARYIKGGAGTAAGRQLELLLGILPRCRNAKAFDRDAWKEKLDEKLVGLEEIKKCVIDTLYTELVCRKKRRTLPLLFVGPPGCGKTQMLRLIAENLGLPASVIDCSGISTGLALVGTPRHYSESAPGLIVTQMKAAGTSEMVLVLDEFDKMKCEENPKDGDPYLSLLQLLNGDGFTDVYVDAPIDCSHTILVATANDIEEIPEVVLQRFAPPIYFQSYTNEEKAEIGKKKTQELVAEFGGLELTFTQEALHRIAWYCEDDGMRRYCAHAERIVRSVIVEGCPKCVIDAEDVDAYLEKTVDPKEPRLIFRRNEPYYTKEIREAIRRCIRRADAAKNSEIKQKYLEQLRLLSTQYTPCEPEHFDVERFRSTLEQSHYGLDSVKRQILRHIYQELMTGSVCDVKLLLAGETGVGKTSIGGAIARGLNRPLVSINLQGMTDPRELRGFSGTYRDAEAGVIVKKICEAGTKRCVVRFDELDKAGYAVQNAILDLLDSSNRFVDSFLSVPLSFEETVFILTCNDLSKVIEPLRSRLFVIDIGDYSEQDKYHIVEDYILPKLCRKYAMNPSVFEMEEEAVWYLIRNYAGTPGVRELEQTLETYVLDLFVRNDGYPKERFVCTQQEMQEFLCGCTQERRRIGF